MTQPDLPYTDQTQTVAQLKHLVDAFQCSRGWKSLQNPKNLAISIAIEAAELMEHFQWQSLEASEAALADAAKRREVAFELADILIYCLGFATATGVDISAAIYDKLAINAGRWPAVADDGSSTG